MKSSIDSVLNTKDPGAAGKIYDDDYVLIPSDQIILRTNIQKLSELKENILKEEKNVKGHLNSLFATKSGKLIPGKQCSQSFDEESITAHDEVKKKIEDNLKDLNDKLSQCKDMFKGTLLFKNKSRKRSKKQNKRKNKKRKEQRENENIKKIIQIISPDSRFDQVVDDVNIEALTNLSPNQVEWLTRMAEKDLLTTRAISEIKEYVKGFMQEHAESAEYCQEEDKIESDQSDDNSESLTDNENGSENVEVLNINT